MRWKIDFGQRPYLHRAMDMPHPLAGSTVRHTSVGYASRPVDIRSFLDGQADPATTADRLASRRPGGGGR